MAEKCILCFVCIICGISFLLIPESCKGSSLPIQFWAGDNTRLANRIKNISSYNKEMSKLYHYYSAIFFISAVIGLASLKIGYVLLIANAVFGIGIVYICYRKILKKHT